MPYIDQHSREELDGGLEAFTPGHLNYQITKLLVAYWNTQGHRYQTINDILGALEGAKQEFYRRVAVPYEETKRTANGDVYGNPTA